MVLLFHMASTGPEVTSCTCLVPALRWLGQGKRGAGRGLAGIALSLPMASLGFPTGGPSQSSWTSHLAAQALTASATKNQGTSCKVYFHCILLVREAAKEIQREDN